jgi:hypothetical protein
VQTVCGSLSGPLDEDVLRPCPERTLAPANIELGCKPPSSRAVVLDLVDPARPFWRLLRKAWELRRDEGKSGAHARHGRYLANAARVASRARTKKEAPVDRGTSPSQPN